MEDDAVRLLLIHADKFEYETKEKAVKEPESVVSAQRKGAIEDGLVAFCTVEKLDEVSPEKIVENSASSIEEVLGWLRTKRVMVYPYAHLSANIASPETALRMLKSLEQRLADKNYEVTRSPFGWYKSFTLTCKGHPLSELSRTITAQATLQQAVTTLATEYKVMDLDGNLHDPRSYQYKPGEEEFRSLVEKEALKKELTGGDPHFLTYARRFGIEWEAYADVGQMRFGPEATLVMDLLEQYANHVVRGIGIPILNVKGTNMFDVTVKPIKEHLQLFGSRAYEVKVDERTFVLRYAACFQQFSMVKDWTLSYRNLPFGTFEVADSYRMEQSGELLLSFRLRKFLMPDLHIYLKNLQEAIDVGRNIHGVVYKEIRKLHREYVSLYNTTKTFFDANRGLFQDLAGVERKPLLINFVPEGIYYWVLNVEYNIIDDLDRPREIGTFQIDVGNAERFGISYADEKGSKVFPVIIHTAVLGGLERFLFTLLDTAVRLEREGRKPMLPVWASPVQARVVPVASQFVNDGKVLLERLEHSGLRADLDDREDTVQSKVRDAELSWIPYVLIYGRKEIDGQKLSVRIRSEGKERSMSYDEFLKLFQAETDGYPKPRITFPALLSKRPGYKRY